MTSPAVNADQLEIPIKPPNSQEGTNLMHDGTSDERDHFGGPPPDSLLRYSWIVEEAVAVGPAPRNYEVLRRLGFDAAVNLQEETEPGPLGEPEPDRFRVISVPIRDGVIDGVPTVEQVTRAAESIHELVQDELSVYVHCFAGVGRSPMACIAYLARYTSMTLDEAIQRVLVCHRSAEPNADQLAAVDGFLATAKTGY